MRSLRIVSIVTLVSCSARTAQRQRESHAADSIIEVAAAASVKELPPLVSAESLFNSARLKVRCGARDTGKPMDLYTSQLSYSLEIRKPRGSFLAAVDPDTLAAKPPNGASATERANYHALANSRVPFGEPIAYTLELIDSAGFTLQRVQVAVRVVSRQSDGGTLVLTASDTGQSPNCPDPRLVRAWRLTVGS